MGKPNRKNQRRTPRAKQARSHNVFQNTIFKDLRESVETEFVQLQWIGPLTGDLSQFAPKPPKMLSEVNPTNLLIRAVLPFQKQPLDSSSTTKLLRIQFGLDAAGKNEIDLSLSELLNLDNRVVKIMSVGIQFLPVGGTDNVIKCLITTKVNLYPQTTYTV